MPCTLFATSGCRKVWVGRLRGINFGHSTNEWYLTSLSDHLLSSIMASFIFPITILIMFDHVTYCLCGTLLLIGHAPPFKLKLYLIPLSEQYSVGVHMMILHSFMFWHISGVWGECGEPGEVRAGDQVPAAAVPTCCCYLGNRGGQTIILTVSILMPLPACPNLSASRSISHPGSLGSNNGWLYNLNLKCRIALTK